MEGPQNARGCALEKIKSVSHSDSPSQETEFTVASENLSTWWPDKQDLGTSQELGLVWSYDLLDRT